MTITLIPQKHHRNFKKMKLYNPYPPTSVADLDLVIPGACHLLPTQPWAKCELNFPHL